MITLEKAIERFPDRSKWTHPSAECRVSPDFFRLGVEITFLDPAPGDARRGDAMTLPPHEARRIAAEIIKAAEAVEKMDAQAIISRVPGDGSSSGTDCGRLGNGK